MIDHLRKLVRRAFPGFPAFYHTRLGRVVAISDAPGAEAATDRFRPRYAVDVEALTAQGEPDAGMPILKSLPLPVFGAGNGRGIFAFPDVGAQVRLAFDYGLPSHPYIVSVVLEGLALPALAPGDLLIQQTDGVFLRFGANGKVTLSTDGEMAFDALKLTIAADTLEETFGDILRTVDGDVEETVGGSVIQIIMGALARSIGGDARLATLGGEDRTIAGDKNELVGGKAELVAQMALKLKANLGNVLVEAVVGSAEFKAAVEAAVKTAASAVTVTDASVDVT